MLALAAAAFVLGGPVVPKRLVIVSWDAGADWVVDRLLAEGKLPNVERMAREGARAESVTQAFPSKTAVGHFTLFSGTWPRKSGVVNNSVPLLPKEEHTILETRSGFDAASHLTEPLWVTTSKAGLRTVALSAAGSYPPAPDQDRLRALHVPLNRYVEFSGFEAEMFADRIVKASGREGKETVGDREITWQAVDDPWDATHGYDTLRVSIAGTSGSFDLKPGMDGKWSAPIMVRNARFSGLTYLRLYELNPQTGQPLLFVRGASGMQGTQSPEENARYLEGYGGFHDDAFSPYQRGLFGKTIYEGGDGTAENWLLDAVAFDLELSKRSFRYGLKRYPGQVYFQYTPQSDNAGHCWMGLLDPASGAYQADIAAKLWPVYAKVFEMQDAWLGDMMRAAGPDTAFALVSDHGMEGIDSYFNVNVVLERAKLLSRNPDGSIDLTKTRVCAPPWGDNQLVVNTVDRKGGIVGIGDKVGVLAAAEKALLDAREANGRPIVTRVFRPDEAPTMGIGGPAGGDLYFDLAPSYYPSTRAAADIVTTADLPRGAGVHGFWPLRRKMQAIFYLWGPGVKHGARLPAIRAIDVAPTLCRLLGIAPSPDNEGIEIGQAFP